MAIALVFLQEPLYHCKSWRVAKLGASLEMVLSDCPADQPPGCNMFDSAEYSLQSRTRILQDLLTICFKRSDTNEVRNAVDRMEEKWKTAQCKGRVCSAAHFVS
jgi:hypothetical protein